MICEICETEIGETLYDDGTCQECGQGYEYFKGYALTLTEEQLKILRRHYKFRALTKKMEEE